MKTRKSRLALSILAGGLSFVGSAHAANLLQNSSFETYSGGGNVFGQRGTNDWIGYFSQYNNTSEAYFDGPNIPASESPGSYYSWRQASEWSTWGNFVTPEDPSFFLQNEMFAYSLTQTVALTNALTTGGIDSGQAQYSFSGWMASYNGNPEQPYLVLRFFNDAATTDPGTGTQIGGNVILDRTTNTFAVTYADGNTSIPADLSNDHYWIKYVASGTVPAGARKARVYVTRSPNMALQASPDTYIDLVKLDVVDLSQTTVVDSAMPANGQTNVSPAAVVNVVLRDVNTQVDTNTIQVTFDAGAVSPSIQKSGILTTITYDPPGVLAPFSTHTYKIVWSDNGGPVTTRTNQVTFTVAPYVNIITGPPIYQEPFDGVAEGSLPAGWSASNSTDSDIPGSNLNDYRSDTYQNWTVLSRSTLSNIFTVVPGGNYYTTTLNVAPNQWVNSAPVTNLVNTNFVLAPSAGRYGNQVQYLTTADYNLSGRANVQLVFSEVYAQYNNNIGAVEYSINGGATWLPALYLIDNANIVRDSNGNIDASNTFAAVHSGVPSPGNFGAFIGVAQSQWATLAPYISGRASGDLVSSARVEAVRLAQADNQAAVRFRFTQAAADSYYFAIDDFGLYSFTPAAPVITSPPVSQSVAIGNSAGLQVSAIGLGPLTYQWRHAGTNLPSNTGASLALTGVQSGTGGSYDVIVSNSGGSVTSAPAILSAMNPLVLVSGQWDFISNSLAASYGISMQFNDATVQANTTFGSTTGMGIPDINGAPTTVMHFTPPGGQWGGYKLYHNALPNGGGTMVNQYTLIYDIYYPGSSDFTYRSLWQTDVSNGSDGDLFINPGNGIGITSIYDGVVTAGEWHRIAVAFDLSGPGQAPVLTKFVDGVKVGNQTSGLSGKDGRFAVGPYGLLFADNDGDVAEAYVSSVQFSNGRRPDAFIQALGGPNALKIPGAIRADIVAGNVVVRWSGGVPLQSAPAPSGPWTLVPGTAGQFSYTPPAGPVKYYRPQIP